MLSLTYSIQDVKTRLNSTYSDYGFSSETEYTNAIIIALDDVQLLWMYPAIGSTYYATIQAKDKVSLTELEAYLYWAEIYCAASGFLVSRSAAISLSSSTASSESLSVEGYSYEMSSSSGNATSYDVSINTFYDHFIHYMCLAGYNPHQLQRGGSVFGESRDLLADTTIIL